MNLEFSFIFVICNKIFSLGIVFIKQLLDEVEHDIMVAGLLQYLTTYNLSSVIQIFVQ